MDGVTVLHEYLATTEFWFLIPAVVGVLLGVEVIYAICQGDNSASIGFILVAILLFLALGVWDQDRVPHAEVIVSPDVSFVEVLERYNVVERKGDIWVLEPLEEKTNE